MRAFQCGQFMALLPGYYQDIMMSVMRIESKNLYFAGLRLRVMAVVGY